MSTRLNSIRNIWGRLMQPHPEEPVMYFSPFVTTIEPEIDFNMLQYYAGLDYFLSMDPIPINVVREQLIHSLDDETTTFIPDSVMVLGEFDVKAAYYPTLSDLESYLHKGSAVFARWMCEKSVGVVGAPLILEDIVPVFDRKPLVMTDHLPIYTIPFNQKKHIFIGSKVAAIHVMEVNTNIKLVSLNVFSCKTKVRRIRYHRISVFGHSVDVPGAPNFPKGATFIVWNSRNVNRSSFTETFNKLYNVFLPEVLVVTEARADASLLGYVKDVLQGVFSVDGFGLVNGYFSVLLICQKSDVYPWTTYRGDEAFGQQMGVDIAPGAKFQLSLDRLHPTSTWFEDRGGYEDGAINSDNDHLSL